MKWGSIPIALQEQVRWSHPLAGSTCDMMCMMRPHTPHPAHKAQLTVVSLMMVMVRVSYHCGVGGGRQAGGAGSA